MTKRFSTLSLKFTSLALILAMSGCAEYHRRVLENTPEAGPQFTRSLAREYGELGDIEQNDMFDYWSANYYYRKAICAKEGHCVAPTCLDKWSLPEDKIPELATARKRLVRALASGARQRAPRLAAHAQTHFDCWVEQQAEEWQHKDIAACRLAFYRAMAEVEFLLMGGTECVLPDYHVFFGLNSTSLNPRALNLIQKLACAHKGKHILLVGRTDRLGESYHNKRLAQARALVVKHELMRSGISPHFITVKQGGPLPGPKINAHDRRVDIVILRY